MMKSISPPVHEPPQVGLQKTLHLLASTPNEAAVALLVPALDSADPTIQHGALRALLERRSPHGQREILKRLHGAPESWRQIIDSGSGRMTAALRDAVLSSDEQICRNGCQAILWFRDYDLAPTLVNATEDDANPNAELVARTLVELADLLYADLAASRGGRDRRDPQLVRRHFTASLEASLTRYLKHSRKEVVSAFLTLAGRDNALLKQILQNSHHAAYQPVVDELMHSERGGVIRLLLGFLDDAHAPSSAIGLLARRGDFKFVQHVLRKIGYEPSAAASQNLRRMEHIGWIQNDRNWIDQLDDAAQHSLVQLVMASGVKRLETFKTIELVLSFGKPAGRRAAAVALAKFNGAEANALTLKALNDPDPMVQASILPQLRPRGIPGVLTRLIEAAESPNGLIRQAACDSLNEFSFDRYLASFDMLDEEVRRTTGALVRKISPDAPLALVEELQSRSRTRRLRAVSMAVAMGLSAEVESTMIEMLADEDHLVRAEAARALGDCTSPQAMRALSQGLNDRSLIVQESAERSLRQIEAALARHATLQEQGP